jgi:hypothetical protein
VTRTRLSSCSPTPSRLAPNAIHSLDHFGGYKPKGDPNELSEDPDSSPPWGLAVRPRGRHLCELHRHGHRHRILDRFPVLPCFLRGCYGQQLAEVPVRDAHGHDRLLLRPWSSPADAPQQAHGLLETIAGTAAHVHRSSLARPTPKAIHSLNHFRGYTLQRSVPHVRRILRKHDQHIRVDLDGPEHRGRPDALEDVGVLHRRGVHDFLRTLRGTDDGLQRQVEVAHQGLPVGPDGQLHPRPRAHRDGTGHHRWPGMGRLEDLQDRSPHQPVGQSRSPSAASWRRSTSLGQRGVGTTCPRTEPPSGGFLVMQYPKQRKWPLPHQNFLAKASNSVPLDVFLQS